MKRRTGRGAECGRWRALWAQSLRIGLRSIPGALRHPPLRRAVLNRLLVPLDPWRYYELGRIAGEPFHGRCLDVSSPKLLMSLLQREGRGAWTGVDLFSDEIQLWGALDPALDLRVEDARKLSFPDESFDTCVCISVIEHIRPDGDLEALQEMWRVLRPGGVLHLTTNVAATARDVYVDGDTWGEATERVGDRVFFEHRLDESEVASRLLALPWEVRHRETVIERRGLSEALARIAPAGYLLGPLLRFVAPGNFEHVSSADEVRGQFGVVYLRLRKILPRHDDDGDSSEENVSSS